MVKLLENTFRSVNIALANEMALACHSFGVNVWEVIEAAKQNLSVLCLSIRGRVSVAIVFPSTRII